MSKITKYSVEKKVAVYSWLASTTFFQYCFTDKKLSLMVIKDLRANPQLFLIGQGFYDNTKLIPTLTPEVFGIHNMVWKLHDFNFGWVEGLSFSRQNSTATVNHIAVHKNAIGGNLGKSLCLALGIHLKQHFGVKVIIFDEQYLKGKYCAYKNLFESKLGAKCINSNGTWCWDISELQ